MTERIRAFDWAATPLGPIGAWPQSLKTATGLLLASPVPIVMLWGVDGVMIYNDAYSVFAGGRHPHLLGCKVREGWPEVAEFNDNVMRVGLAGGTLAYKDQELILNRTGTPQSAWMDLDYWPVPDESGAPAGVIATVVETTERVLAERRSNQAETRQRVLLDLNDAVRDLTDPAEIAHVSARMLARALGVTRAGYGVMDVEAETITVDRDYNEPEVSSIAGVLRFRDFGSYIENLKQGETVAIADSRSDPRTRDTAEALAGIGVASFINMPLMENGRVVALVFVNHVAPRDWSEADVDLMREIAERVRTAAERARASVALRESEARFRNMADNTPMMMWVTDPTGSCVYLNRTWYEFTGQTEAEAEGFGWLDATHPDDKARAGEAFVAANAAQAPFRFEYRLRRADGTYRWAIDAASPRFDANGEYLGYVGSVIDIDERREVEDALRASEAQFRAFAQAVPNHVWASRPDGELYWFNAQVYAYAGVPEGALDGASWGDIVHPEDLPVASEAWARSLATGAPYHTEFRIRGGDGAWRWFTVRAEPVRDADGAITQWVGANIDIDDIRHQGEELTRVNATLAELLAGSKAERDRLWTLSEDVLARANYAGQLVAVNPAWTRILGWSEDELLTNPYADIIDPANLGDTVAELEKMSQTGQATRFENSILGKDGQWKPIGWTLAPEPDGEHFIAVGRDLTEDKAREAELRVAHEALRQSQKMEAVGQLTGGIAHDFNNLLAGISGSLELLEKRIGEGRLAGVERYISAAQGASRRAASLTQRLLAFSRRQTLDPKPTDVNRLIAGMEDLIRRSVGPEVEVEVVGSSGLWPTRIDPSQLENALLNLCINGRDAMAPEGGRLTIETANKWLDDKAARIQDLPPGQYISLCVTDAGTGMSPEVIAQAFDPFFTTKPMGQGTGLGLSMVHGFVRQSGGQVRIYSEPGQGTTVCLYMPRYTGQLTESEDTAAVIAEAMGAHGETVLVIDDEPTVRMLVVEVLEEAGYIVMEAEDGPTGLAILRSDARIDLLVSDVGLPGGMNGRQVADAARLDRPDLKVLFITGYAENAAVGNGLLDPGMAVITKPFAVAALGEKVREMIEG